VCSRRSSEAQRDEFVPGAGGGRAVGLASGIRRDLAAIEAALVSKWSTGQVEGQNHRLKLLKRQMYGRAGFELLRKRVLNST
jgi:transposase